MPTYDYVCSKCGHAFEAFQGINDAPLTKCAKCGKKGAKRQLGTGAGLLFKGSGFYITDYRSEGYKAAAKSDSGSSASPKSESSGSKSSTKSPKKSA